MSDSKILFQDGRKFVTETTEKFDVIIVDGSDPVGPSAVLFSKDFYQNIYRILNDDGVFVTQSESPFLHTHLTKPIVEALHGIFPIVKLYWGMVPEYPGSIWSWTLASKKYNPTEDIQSEAIKKDNLDLKVYNKEYHRASFMLPTYMKRAHTL